MTQTIDQKVQDKLRKLQALAERGVGGEQATAQRMLERMLARHGLMLDDLADERRDMLWFPARTTFERRLAMQILAKVCNTNDPPAYRSKGRPKQVGVKVTPAEAIEFELHYDTLRNALEVHFQEAFSAFVQANKLFPSLPSAEPEPLLTERDWRIMNIAAAVQPTPINPRLECSEEVAHG